MAQSVEAVCLPKELLLDDFAGVFPPRTTRREKPADQLISVQHGLNGGLINRMAGGRSDASNAGESGVKTSPVGQYTAFFVFR